MTQRPATRVLLVGWDAADWKHIHPLLERGWLPNLQRLIDRGAWGNLATLHPILSPMLWNTIATGKRPHKHGILGFVEPAPDGKGIRPSTSTTRRAKAVWNILTQTGHTTNVIGWFCGHPAEPINGLCVSEMFQKVSVRGHGPAPDAHDWPLPDRTVHPPRIAEQLAPLRLHPAELTEAEILPFIPRAAEIDQTRDRRLESFAKLFSEMVSVHNAATFALDHNDWDFAAVYYDSIDHFSHAFMEYHPPRMAGVSERDFEIYKDVVTGCYRFHDMMLGRLLDLAGADATVILCSDHGFHCDHLRPAGTPHEPAGPAVWHREYGIVVMAGPGIKTGERIHGASLLDIAPTILALMGQPIGNDMDGKPLVAVFEAPGWIQRLDSWEDVEGECGMHAADQREDPYEARQAIQQLVDLGYIDQPDENDQRAAEQADREAKYNLARAYLDGAMVDEATELLDELFERYPDELRFGMALARCRLIRGERTEARRLAEQLIDRADHQRLDRIEAAERRVAHLQEHREEILQRAEQEASRSAETGKPLRVQVTAESLAAAQKRLAASARRLREYDVRIAPTARLLLGTIDLACRQVDAAMIHLRHAERAEPRLPGLHLKLGQAYLRLRHNEDAVRAFERALRIDPDNAQAHEGLAAALARLGRNEQAAGHALDAVELMHHLPRAHLRLGVTLARLNLFAQAAEAFETCLKLAPMTAIAHRFLARLYATKLSDPVRGAEHRMKAEQIAAWRRGGAAESGR